MAVRRSQPVPAAVDEQSVVHLPTVRADAVASLAPTKIYVDLAGRTWTIPALTAEEWLKILWEDPFDPDRIFPGLAEEEDVDDVLLDAVLAGEISIGEDMDVAMEILETAAGLQWWFALRLTSVLRASWSRLGGVLLVAGIRADQLSLGAWCVAALELCVERLEPRKAAELIDMLAEVPDGVEVDALEPDLADEMAFMEAMNTTF